ncbi:hypothetical protein ACF0H5_008476 [Mactra antiquata]
MIRRDLLGGRRLRRTRNVKKNEKGSTKLNNADIEARDALNPISNIILTNCIETRNNTVNAEDISHDIDSRRQLSDKPENTGTKVSETIQVEGDRSTNNFKGNSDSKSDDLTSDFHGLVKNSHESENSGCQSVRLTTRRPHSQGSPCAFKENEPDVDFYIEEPYIPSWLELKSDKLNMDIKSIRSLGLVPKGLSMSLTDLRPEVGAHASLDQSHDFIPKQQQQQPIIDGKRHKEMEKEYLKLKRKLNIKQNSDHKTSVTNSQHVVLAGSNVRATRSESDIPLYKELFESDELGINHFRKHIHNVKLSSKRHKRALKVPDGTVNRGVPKNRRHITRFQPLYEHTNAEDSGSARESRQLNNGNGHS